MIEVSFGDIIEKNVDVINKIIKKYSLIPHPEGGYFTETYRSDCIVKLGDERLSRSASTAIYFLICPGNCSRLHRIKSDESKQSKSYEPYDVTINFFSTFSN
jgi:predicted cupin superfamily sugar epimerase